MHVLYLSDYQAFEPQVRMAPYEFGESRHDDRLAHGHAHAHAQNPRQGLGRLRGGALKVRKLMEDFDATSVHFLAVLGELKLPRGAVEKRQAQLFFQFRDGMADRGGIEPQQPRGLSEAARLGGAHHQLYSAHSIHAEPLPIAHYS